jgi:hypothetical protein
MLRKGDRQKARMGAPEKTALPDLSSPKVLPAAGYFDMMILESI